MALVERTRYRSLTGDLRTPDDTVDRALDHAQALIEERLGRTLAYSMHTETLHVDRSHYVFPSYTPVDPTTEGYLDEATIGVQALQSSYVWTHYGPTLTITYGAGFTTANLPEGIATAISMLANSFIQGPDPLAVAGASAVAADGVSISWRVVPSPIWPPGVWPLLRRFRHRTLVRT